MKKVQTMKIQCKDCFALVARFFGIAFKQRKFKNDKKKCYSEINSTQYWIYTLNL